MTSPNKYIPCEREQAFLDTVESAKYQRESINGLKPFLNDKAPDYVKGFYSADELEELRALQDTERDVEARMPVKMTRHYAELAQHSDPIRRLVKADPTETDSLAGSEDPGNQMDYSPVEGLLHKYEIGLDVRGFDLLCALSLLLSRGVDRP